MNVIPRLPGLPGQAAAGSVTVHIPSHHLTGEWVTDTAVTMTAVLVLVVFLLVVLPVPRRPRQVALVLSVAALLTSTAWCTNRLMAPPTVTSGTATAASYRTGWFHTTRDVASSLQAAGVRLVHDHTVVQAVRGTSDIGQADHSSDDPAPARSTWYAIAPSGQVVTCSAKVSGDSATGAIVTSDCPVTRKPPLTRADVLRRLKVDPSTTGSFTIQVDDHTQTCRTVPTGSAQWVACGDALVMP